MGNNAILPSVGSKKPGFFYGYVVVISSFFLLILTWGTVQSFGVFLKPIATEFGWTRAAISGAYSMSMFALGLFFIVTGRLNDRFGPRIVVTFCGISLGLAYLLLSQISALWQLYIVYGVMVAIGLSGGFVPLTSTVARWFIKRRGLLTGIVVSGVGVGGFIGPPVAVWLISSYGWRSSFFIIGIIALVLIPLIAQFLRRDPSQKRLRPYGESEVRQEDLLLGTSGVSPQEAINTSQFWIFGAMYFCVGFGINAVLVHLVPYATDLGISTIAAANVLAVIGGLNFMGRIGIGSIGDRIGIKRSLISSFILMLIAFVLLPVAKELWLFYFLASILGFGWGGISTAMSPAVAELFGMKAHGAILGSVSFIAMTGGAAGPILAGYIFDKTGSYYIAFMLFVVLGVTGLILASLFKPIRGHHSPKV